MDAHQMEVVATKAVIAEAMFRYCRGIDRMDRGMAIGLWHPGGTADYSPWYVGDAAGLIEWLWNAHATLVAHVHQVHNVVIELDGARAASEAYFTAVLRLEPSPGRLVDRVVRGRYLDTWSERDGAWRVDHRRVVQDVESVSDVRTTGTSDETSRRGPDDPSYEVFGPAG
jgi:hypothetical protein